MHDRLWISDIGYRIQDARCKTSRLPVHQLLLRDSNRPAPKEDGCQRAKPRGCSCDDEGGRKRPGKVGDSVRDCGAGSLSNAEEQRYETQRRQKPDGNHPVMTEMRGKKTADKGKDQIPDEIARCHCAGLGVGKAKVLLHRRQNHGVAESGETQSAEDDENA